MNSKLTKGLEVKDAFEILRMHTSSNPFKGSVKSPCMHAGKIIGDHTTSSMVVELLKNDINVYFTLGSLPCISVYKKWKFGSEAIYPIVIDNKIDESYYRIVEKIKKK